jgi:mRNA-degrading endonuclease RelE of RelBE toxin-antitoxin system
MQLRIERRAEIALRSLQKTEQRYIERALNELQASDRATLRHNSKIRIIASSLPGRKLFVYKGSAKLRLVLSFDDDTCVIEDVVDHDRLDRLLKREGQE